MKRDLEAMAGIFSEKALLFFHMSIYRKYAKLAAVLGLVFSGIFIYDLLFRLLLFHLLYFSKIGGGSESDELRIISNAVLACLGGLGYIGFILTKTQKIFVTFKKINPNAKFLQNYRLVHNKELDRKLNVVVTGFLARLDKLTIKRSRRKNMLSIYKLLSFYLNLVRLKAKDDDSEVIDERFMFQNKDDHVNLYQMLQMVNDYFNNFEIKTKVLFSSKSADL